MTRSKSRRRARGRGRRARRPTTAVANPLARSPFSTNAAIRGSSSAMRIRLIGGTSVRPADGRRSGLSDARQPGARIVDRPAPGRRCRTELDALPPCAVGDRAGRSPARARRRPSAASPAAAAGEPLEDPLAVVGGDARAGVARPSSRSSCRADARRRARSVARRGVLDRVVGELQQRLGEALRVERDDHGPARLAVDPPSASAEPADLVEHLVESAPRRRSAAGATKSGRSALASMSRSSTMRFIRSSSSSTSGDRLADVGGVVGVEQLEVPAHDRDRGAQLVPGVVEEARAGRRTPSSSRSSIALTAAARAPSSSRPSATADAAGQVGLGDRLRRVGDVADRPQDPARDQPRGPAASRAVTAARDDASAAAASFVDARSWSAK